MDAVLDPLRDAVSQIDLGEAAFIVVPLLWIVGVGTAIDAVMHSRTPQGSTAWVFALIAFPFVAVPAYWLVGRFTFDDYIGAIGKVDDRIEKGLREAIQKPPFHPPDAEGREAGETAAFGALATVPFTCGNSARLLIDGEDTFQAILESIERAQRYVLVQFYTFRADQIGHEFQAAMLRAAERGCRVYLLYDAIGSLGVSRTFLKTFRDAGIETTPFTGPRAWLKRLRLNFRNHRKIVVVDGREAFVGGLNVGDEYLGRDPKMSPWRDTHLAVEGPTVQGLQISFFKDWFYARDEAIGDLDWEPHASPQDQTALMLASGPADTVETCGLLYSNAIESAEKRLWIASPYFVPDGRVLGALELAALRGVDVRVIMPRKSDSVFFKYVPYAFLEEIARVGVKVFLYEDGFMHQKVSLVDRDFATVGTANFDNRSFRLNFETTVVVRDEAFCDQVAAMLEADLAKCTQISEKELVDAPFYFRFAAGVTRLLAPML